MKNRYFAFQNFIIGIVSLLSSFNSFSQAQNNVDSIVICKAEYNTYIPFSVCCEEIFENFEIKKVCILNKDSISNLISNVSNLKETEFRVECIDTRAVLYFYYNDKEIVKLCIGTTKVVLFNGKIMELKDRNIFGYIWK